MLFVFIRKNIKAGLSLRSRNIIAFACVLAVWAAGSSCKDGSPVSARNNPGGEGREPRQVKTVSVSQMPMERAISVTGTLAAYDEATVSAKVAGRVRSLAVDLGSAVRKGQVIAQLEQQDYTLRLKQAEAALAQARARVGLSPDGTDDQVVPENTSTVRQEKARLEEATLKRARNQTLLAQGIISRAQFDTSEAEYKVALNQYQDAIEEVRNRQALVVQRRSELEIARQQLKDTTIAAPFDGMVKQRTANQGEYLAPGAPVVTIVRNDPLRLRVEVPERESRSVRQGQQVRVSVEGDSNAYTGQIVRISPTITAENRVLIVEAEVRNNGALRPGSFARADIVTDDSGLALAVPTNAVVTFAGIEKVIMVQEGKAVEKPITTGRRAGDWTEVLSGVSAGDLVVVNPGNLQSGQPVSITE
jgi:RND family efflux transporter MFP subunit